MNKFAISMCSMVALSFLYLVGAMAQAQTQTVGDVAQSLTWGFFSFHKLFIPFCVVAGLLLTIKGLFKLKEYTDTKGKTPVSECILYICAGALLISVSGIIGVGKEMMGLQNTNAHDIKQYVQEPKY